MPVFLSGWNYRKPIKYGTTKPTANLAGFPVCLKIVSDTDIGAVLSTRKFAVTDADGVTQIPYGNYNDFVVSAGACTFTLRFKQSLLSAASTGDVMGYLYYDTTQEDQADRAGSLPSGRIFFMPMEEDPTGAAPQMVDWTGNHNGTTHSAVAGDLVAGEVAKALNFDRLNYVSIPDAVELQLLGTDFTISAWGKWTSVSGSIFGITKKANYADVDGWECYAMDDGAGGWYFDFLGDYGDNNQNYARTQPPSDTGIWHRFDVYFDHNSGGLALFLDSVVQSLGHTYANSPVIQTGAQDLIIGPRDAAAGVGPNGPMDEVAIDTVARPQEWMTYAYQNDKNNSDTVTLGAQEAALTPIPPIPPVPPVVTSQHGTGAKPIRIHPEVWREWQKKYEYDRILAEAVRKAHLEREDEEFATALAAGLFD